MNFWKDVQSLMRLNLWHFVCSFINCCLLFYVLIFFFINKFDSPYGSWRLIFKIRLLIFYEITLFFTFKWHNIRADPGNPVRERFDITFRGRPYILTAELKDKASGSSCISFDFIEFFLTFLTILYEEEPRGKLKHL